jgi:tetratricopeptide (TPR) repeat protein
VSGLISTGIIGWFARDRMARRTVAEATANSALEEVMRLMQQEKWPQALIEVRRAEDVLTTSGAVGASTTRVHDLRNDIEMVLRLEEIRFGPETEQTDGTLRHDPETDRKNAEAFREYGIDIESLAPAAAAERIARRDIRLELATALDAWALWRTAFIPNDNGWKRLVEIARLVDPDPWRNRLRDVIETDEKDRPTALTKLAESIDAENLPPQTIMLLASLLYDSGAHGQALAPLLAVRRRHPNNYRINFQLADHYFRMSPQQINQAIRYLTAAQALRPESAVTHNRLGAILMNDEEAINHLHEAIRLSPTYGSPYFNLGMIFRNRGSAAKAVIYFEKAYQLMPDDLLATFVLAELLAVSRDDKVRNGERAVELAKKVCERTNYKNPEMMAILAEAYAETSDFETAIQWSKKAIQLTDNDEHREIFKKNLAAFQEARPWRADKW